MSGMWLSISGLALAGVMRLADAYFFLEQIHETLQPFVASLCQTLAGGCLESVRQVQQLGLEMVEAKTFVIVLPVLRLRILWIVQRAAHTSGDVKGARHAEHAKGVETVGVLHDFRFERGRRDVGGKLCASMAWATALIFAPGQAMSANMIDAFSAAIREA